MKDNDSRPTEWSTLRAQYDRAREWVETFGFAVKGTRLEETLSVLDAVIEKYGDRSWMDTGDEEAHRYAHCVSDILELIDVQRACSGLAADTPGLRDRIRRLCSGAPGYRRETASQDDGRNIAFELQVAGWLRKCGYEFDPSCGDVRGASDELGSLAVECKRIRSDGGLHNHLLRAAGQLDTSTNKQPATYRAIALSIAEAIPVPDGRAVRTAADDADVRARAEAETNAFISTHLWTIDDALLDRGIEVTLFFHVATWSAHWSAQRSEYPTLGRYTSIRLLRPRPKWIMEFQRRLLEGCAQK